MEQSIDNITSVARGISDFGMLTIAAASYLIISLSLMMAVFKWFRTIIDRIIEGNATAMSDILSETRTQNDLLNDISEGLKQETLMRIKSISGVFFDLSKEQVCRMIKKIREENHIADHDATGAKIRMLLRNIHDDRNSRFDSFRYRGRKLSSYTDPAWIEKIAAVIEGEIYHVDGPNNGRAYSNVSMAYDNIRIDFYHRLIN